MAPWLVGALLLACAGSTGARPSESAGPRSQAPEGFWEHWGDGQAELSGYALTQARYGELRQGEAVLIYVTETFTDAQRVKSDGGHPDEYPVLKLNDSRHFGTGIYDYRTMTSAWVRLDGGAPLGLPAKISTSVQEWCGHAWLQLLVDPGRYRLTQHSYFDGEGDRAAEAKVPEGALFGDALPLLVRGLAGELLAPGASRTAPYLGTLLDARLTHKDPSWGRATLSRSAATAPAPGTETPAWTWELTVEGGLSTRWYVEEAAPHRLLGWSRSDGEEARVLRTLRTAYWTQNHEGDERLRAELGLGPAVSARPGTDSPPETPASTNSAPAEP